MSKSGTIRAAGLCALFLGSMSAGALAVPPANTPAVANALAGKVKLEDRKSDFTKQAVARNPFWPVAWKPGDKKVDRQVTKINPEEIFTISSIMLGPPDLVFINGKRYETGESLPVDVGTKTIEFRIVKIQDGGVIMAYGKQQFPLRKRRANPDSANRKKP